MITVSLGLERYPATLGLGVSAIMRYISRRFTYLLTYLLTYRVCFTGRLFNSNIFCGFSGLGGGIRSTECRSSLMNTGTIRPLTDETKQ